MSEQPHACPACGRGLDPLRAGEVAFVDGKFVYFCDREHKTRWLAGRGTSDEVETSEPPAVAPPKAEPAISMSTETEEEPRSMPIRAWTPTDAPAPAIRGGSPERAPEPAATTSAASVLGWLGILTGAMSLAVALIGSTADVARLPLAGIAAGCACVYALLVRKSVGRPVWLSFTAVLAALGCAAWASNTASANVLASSAGLCAASFVVVLMTLARAAEPVATLRGAILSALEVTGSADDVRPGEQVTVHAGDVVPVDGIVTAGEAVVSPWLDASADVTKREGMPVVAGAKVLSGTLRITATWTGRERAFGRLLFGGLDQAPLLALVGQIEARGVLPFGLLVGGVSFANGATVPESAAAAAAAILGFAVPAASFAVWLLHARTQLKALHHGIVYRDAHHFDLAARARTAVVCARGTVLLGEPEIVALDALADETDGQHVLALASALATGSQHPFATAILRAARARYVRPDNVRNTVQSGSGATAVDAQGARLVLGRRAFRNAEKVSMAVADLAVREHEALGRSVLLVARAGRVVGIVALQDGLRAGARAAVQKLHDAHIEPVLLSGEARETCEAIGRALDIEHIRPEVSGPDRGTEVRALGEGGDVIAVLGHPAADDAALASAGVSVALDAAGASPGEWSVALACDDVRAAADALIFARTARERSLRILAMALLPGVLVSLALAFLLLPPTVVPIAGALTASVTLLYAKE